jgi:hypothetical protein
MHRGVRDKLEEILAGTVDGLCERHLDECEECRAEVAAMREQRGLLRTLRAGGEIGRPVEIEPSAGFYARVMERIESQGVVSIWSLFFDSPVGRGLAMASMVIALSLGVYLVSMERGAEPDAVVLDSGQAVMQQSGGVLTGSPDANAVLVNLVTYREQ